MPWLPMPWNTRRSLASVLVWWGGIIGVFSVLYALIPPTRQARSLWECVYLSVAVFTTLGHSDLAHLSPVGKGMVMVEVTLGYMLLGVFVGLVSRRLLGE